MIRFRGEKKTHEALMQNCVRVSTETNGRDKNSWELRSSEKAAVPTELIRDDLMEEELSMSALWLVLSNCLLNVKRNDAGLVLRRNIVSRTFIDLVDLKHWI